MVAQYANQTFQFTFFQDEGKIDLTDAQIKAAGVTIQAAGVARINSTITLPGEIHFNEDKTSHVVPRLAGVAESIPANLGQQVKKAQVLGLRARAYRNNAVNCSPHRNVWN